MAETERSAADLPYPVRLQLAIHVRGLCSRTRCCLFCRLSGLLR